MLGYTRGIVGDTIDSIKKIAIGVDIFAQLVYIVYLSVALVMRTGQPIANAVLLFLSIAYFIYYLVTLRRWYTKKELNSRKKAKLFLRCSKRLVNLAVIVVAIIEICLKPNETDNIKLLLTILMIFGFVTSIILDLIVGLVSARLELIYTAVKLDMENIKKPLKAPINLFKRATGREVEEVEVDPKLVSQLETIKENQKQLKKRKKLWKREKSQEPMPETEKKGILKRKKKQDDLVNT